MSAVIVTAKRVSLGAAIASGLTFAVNQAVGTIYMDRQAASCDIVNAASTGTVTILFHGIWDGPGRMNALVPICSGFGPVIQVGNGSNVKKTPASVVRELNRLDWQGRDLQVIGFSLGTRTALHFLRLMREQGRPVRQLTLISGPARKRDPIWPHPLLPLAVQLVQPGPIAEHFWRDYWRKKSAHAPTADQSRQWTGSAAAAKWNLDRSAGTGVSGARILARLRDPRPADFAGTPYVHIIEHTSDHMVQSCLEEWRKSAPHATHTLIPGPGHGDFETYSGEYRTAIAGAFVSA